MEQIVQIPTEKLLPNPYQPRKQFKSEDMLSLADSIKENGVLQPQTKSGNSCKSSKRSLHCG